MLLPRRTTDPLTSPRSATAATEVLQAAGSRLGWGRVQSCSGVWAGVWLTLPPTEHGLSFLDCEYAALARFRLGLPLDPEGGPCRHGGGGGRQPRGWYDPEGEHASYCLSNSGTRPSDTTSFAMSSDAN